MRVLFIYLLHKATKSLSCSADTGAYCYTNSSLLCTHCSVLCVFVQEEYYGRELILADRDVVEQGADEMLKGAGVSDVAFLVVGDPFG